MAHRTTTNLFVLSAIGGLVLALSVPSDALAKKKKAAAPAAAPAAVVVPDSNIPADRAPRCFDSVILYPAPPCY
jgi:hypothetical protein